MRPCVVGLLRYCNLLPGTLSASASGGFSASPGILPPSVRTQRSFTLGATPFSWPLVASPRAGRPTSSSSSWDNPRWRSLPLLSAGLGLSVAVAARMSDADAPRASIGVDGTTWVTELAGRPGVRQVVSTGQMLARNPIRQILLGDDDHLFEAMARVDMVKELRCFYNGSEKQFHAVVQLGRDVCGYPSTVHGGLTAAIIDETLGGLMVSLWKGGSLGVSLPAVTARLEVDYCKTVPQNSLVLCSAQVESIEGRKLWLKASVTDGEQDGTTYATARALFVVPGLMKVVERFVPGIGGR